MRSVGHPFEQSIQATCWGGHFDADRIFLSFVTFIYFLQFIGIIRLTEPLLSGSGQHIQARPVWGVSAYIWSKRLSTVQWVSAETRITEQPRQHQTRPLDIARPAGTTGATSWSNSLSSRAC